MLGARLYSLISSVSLWCELKVEETLEGAERNDGDLCRQPRLPPLSASVVQLRTFSTEFVLDQFRYAADCIYLFDDIQCLVFTAPDALKS